MRDINMIIDIIKRFWAFIFLGCPICYNIFVQKINHFHRYCPKCHNNFDIRIWKKDEYE